MSSTMVWSLARISVCRRDSLAFLVSSSKDATIYSISKRCQDTDMQGESTLGTSSPQKSSSPHLSLSRSHVCNSWVMPWERMWSARGFASFHARGVPKDRRPIGYGLCLRRHGKSWREEKMRCALAYKFTADPASRRKADIWCHGRKKPVEYIHGDIKGESETRGGMKMKPMI